MKEMYKRPVIANSDSLANNSGAFPAAAVAAAAGYVAGRVVTHAIKASPVTKLPGISRRNSN